MIITLADFDPAIIEEYRITERKLERVIRYVRLLQGKDALTLRDIAVGGYYGTSALLHEVKDCSGRRRKRFTRPLLGSTVFGRWGRRCWNDRQISSYREVVGGRKALGALGSTV